MGTVPDRILDSIETPCDVKGLSGPELVQLADEIRTELVQTVSLTGGHLAPNLGVVELTLGIHRALDCPTDRILFDVGHQSYVHKLLTGRLRRFCTLRQYGGMCGFPKRSESPYDAFDAGHASDSLSVALGLALARDARGTSEAIVAIIGDGSMTGGMAFEALNHIGHLGTPLVIVLNDNEMSISENVGALASYLARVRLDRRYMRLRDGVESKLASTPIGRIMVDAGEAVKGSFKQLVVPGMLFEELGVKYVGPIDGHDIAQVQAAVERAKVVDGPVIIHAVTRKGSGYSHAEDSPDAFHGIAPFSVETGETHRKAGAPVSFTEAFSLALLSEAARDERIVAITAAMPGGTGLDRFAEKFPERFYDVGIAEEHAVGMAAGLALGGMVPVVAVYSTFMQRAYDQMIMDVALQNLHVVFCLDRAGLVGEDGPTHHGVFDLTYLRSIPNMVVLAPADEVELAEALHTALLAEGPVAIRYPRGAGSNLEIPSIPATWDQKAQIRREGRDVALLAVGRMVIAAQKAADLLAAAGISASVVNARWVKPLDSEMVSAAASNHRLLVTIEENTAMGGFGSAVCETLADRGLYSPVLRLAIPDCFVAHGAMNRLLADVGLTPEGIFAAVQARLAGIDAPHGDLTDDASGGMAGGPAPHRRGTR